LGHVLVVRQTCNFRQNEVVLGVFKQNVHVNPNKVLFNKVLARGHNQRNLFADRVGFWSWGMLADLRLKLILG
jgi:hypothetical protein